MPSSRTLRPGSSPGSFARQSVSRRDFLKLAALGMGTLSLSPWNRMFTKPDFPKAERLGRACRPLGRIDVKEKPDYDSKTVKVLYEDSVVPWVHEIVGRHPGRNNQRYVETPDGYIWSADLQPVRNQPNKPVSSLPNGGAGMWVEVTVPFVDLVLAHPSDRPGWVRDRQELSLPLRLYYSQILWIDQLKTDDQGQAWYRVNERYGNPGDIFWAAAEAFRPLTAEEIAPITPDVEDKRVVVDVDWKRQVLSCYEGNSEVYFCQISSGTEQGSTPPGEHLIWRKLISVHMSGGTTNAGYDLPGVGWTTLFVGEGVAIHSTFWHNNFGEPESHGCVNCRPEDAKWIFRWTRPAIDLEPGEKTVQGMVGSKVKILEAA